jgi:multidrug efflux pump subunit AcrA (membrane-fusion protein)
MDSVNATLGLVLTALGIVAIVGGWLRWVRPRWQRARRKVAGVFDAILGRDAIVDSITGKEIEPELPGIGVRMAHQESQMEKLTDAVAILADSHQRISSLEQRVTVLEDARTERAIAQAESAQAWRAIAALHESEPED